MVASRKTIFLEGRNIPPLFTSFFFSLRTCHGCFQRTCNGGFQKSDFSGSHNFMSSKFMFRVGLKLETRCIIPL